MKTLVMEFGKASMGTTLAAPALWFALARVRP